MSFLDYLGSLTATKLDRLYESPHVCQAVLRSLPPLAKQYVLRLLFLDAPLPASLLSQWVSKQGQSKHTVAMETLEQLRVLLVSSSADRKKDEPQYALNPVLCAQLRQSLVQGEMAPMPPHGHERSPSRSKSPPPPHDELLRRSTHQLQALLLHLLSYSPSSSPSSVSSSASAPPPALLHPLTPQAKQTLLQILIQAGFVSKGQGGTGGTATVITEDGFRFLLLDTTQQLWQLVKQYISLMEDQGHDAVPIISYLLEIGFCDPSLPVALSSLTDLQRNVVQQGSLFGLTLVEQGHGKESEWFVPTPLASALSSSLSESASWASQESNQGFIVVETNYRVYAYTSSPLHIEILRVFLRITVLLPNLVVGEMSRESINEALGAGITAEQIVQYLRKHAHPQVANRRPVVPDTVSDQIRLWERDRNRVSFTSVVVYADFPMQELYAATLKYAQDICGTVWQDPKTKKFAAHADLHDEIRAFIRQQGSASGSRKKSTGR